MNVWRYETAFRFSTYRPKRETLLVVKMSATEKSRFNGPMQRCNVKCGKSDISVNV